MPKQIIYLAIDKWELERIINPQLIWHNALIELGVAFERQPYQLLPCILDPFHVIYHNKYIQLVRIHEA